MKLIEESSCDSIIDYALSTVKIVELLILLLNLMLGLVNIFLFQHSIIYII